MANQTEELNRSRRIKTESSGTVGTNSPDQARTSSNPGPSDHSTSSNNMGNIYDFNNNLLIPVEPQPRNTSALETQRKRSTGGSRDTPSAAGLMKRFKWSLALIYLISLLHSIHGEPPGNQLSGGTWDRPQGMPRITQLEVMCGAQHMEVHLSFDAPFHGLVASKGMYGQAGCVYVPPRSGRMSFVFNIYYDKCGTKPDNHGKFYENTVVVQYDEELIEAWDEAKRLRCEWFNDYEKTATKTNPMVISDLEIVELNFHGDNVDCWMEIQEGKGPWAPPLNGIVPLGSPLTMVVAVKDPTGEFDMRVKTCEATDGHGGHVLKLSDADGCILRPKLLGKFSKIRMDDGKATVLTYAYINAFKFPDMLNVHLRCTVEICRHGCPNHCSSEYHLPASQQSQFKGASNFLEPMAYESQQASKISGNELPKSNPERVEIFPAISLHQVAQPEVIHQLAPPVSNQPLPYDQSNIAMQSLVPPIINLQQPGPPIPQGRPGPVMRPRPGGPVRQGRPQFPPRKFPKFPPPQGPHRLGLLPENDDSIRTDAEGRNLQEDTSPEASPSQQEPQAQQAPPLLSDSLTAELNGTPVPSKDTPISDDPFPKGPRQLSRRRRSVSGNSDIIGIQSAFRVISQADLNFALNLTSSDSSRSSSVLKGRPSLSVRPDETIYGVCLPRLGFGIVFFGLGLATLVSVLVASFFAYAHYRQSRELDGKLMGGPEVMSRPDIAHQQYCHQMANSSNSNGSHQPIFPMVILRNIW